MSGGGKDGAVAKVQQWFAALSKRERVMVLATMFLVPVYLFVQLSYLPTRKQQRLMEQSCRTLQQQNQSLQTQIDELNAILSNDVNERTRRDIAAVRHDISRFDRELEQNIRALVPPQAMAQLLRSMLGARAGLTLLVLKNLPAQPITVMDSGSSGSGSNSTGSVANTASADVEPPTVEQAADNAVEAAATMASAMPMLYRHPIDLEISGSYTDILLYVRQLQHLPRRLFWNGIEIVVKDSYPLARVKLRVYTLSFQKGLIGG